MKTSQRGGLESKQKQSREKKSYEPPAIVYRETLEVSAGICPKVITPCAGTQS
jgi:hypothetical protein